MSTTESCDCGEKKPPVAAVVWSVLEFVWNWWSLDDSPRTVKINDKAAIRCGQAVDPYPYVSRSIARDRRDPGRCSEESGDLLLCHAGFNSAGIGPLEWGAGTSRQGDGKRKNKSFHSSIPVRLTEPIKSTRLPLRKQYDVSHIPGFARLERDCYPTRAEEFRLRSWLCSCFASWAAKSTLD